MIFPSLVALIVMATKEGTAGDTHILVNGAHETGSRATKHGIDHGFGLIAMGTSRDTNSSSVAVQAF